MAFWIVELEHLATGIACRRGGLTWRQAQMEAARLRRWPAPGEARSYVVRVYREEAVPVYRG